MKKLVIVLCITALWGCKGGREAEPQFREEVMQEISLFRQGQVPSDSTINALLRKARETGDSPSLCYALYLQGSVYNYTLRFNQVIEPLKEAESLIPSLPDGDPIAGMIYMVQGSALEQNDYLWAQAREKYEAALPYFERSGDTLRLASCYRDIGRMSLWRGDTALYETAFGEAIRLAERQPNRLIYHDICIQYLLNHLPADTAAMMAESQILCDSFGLYRYAWIEAEYYLRKGDAESSARWIETFAADTAYSRWSLEKYHQLRSALLNERGDPQSAYNELRHLYEASMHRIYEEGLSRTYAVARQYDLERERQKTLKLTIEKQRLYLALGGIVLLLLISLLWLLWERSKRLSREHEKELAQVQAAETARQLADRRATLKQILQQRVALAVRLKRQANVLPKEIPAWVMNYIEENAFTNDTNWQDFLHEFQGAYGDLLTRLHKQYPALTQQDDQYLALAILGLDNNEIAVLLNSSDRTIWNRRQKIKTRLGNSKLDLDTFLAHLP